jgi:hypothetical protein
VTRAPAALVASTTSDAVVSAGAVVSLTVTAKVAVDRLPAASVATSVTAVVPRANCDPEGAE